MISGGKGHDPQVSLFIRGVLYGIQQSSFYVPLSSGSSHSLLCAAETFPEHDLVFIQFVFLCLGGTEICVPDASFNHRRLLCGD